MPLSFRRHPETKDTPRSTIRRRAATVVVSTSLLFVGACDSTGSLGSSDSTNAGAAGEAGISGLGTVTVADGTTVPDVLNSSVEKLRPVIVAEHPWNKESFTQGLELADDGQLVVGTGMYGDSRIYRTTLDGKESHSHDLDDDYFGEGITVHEDSVWQLTWKKGVAIHRNLDDLSEKNTANYEGEGWGLCSQGERLVMSNGSGTLSFRDPETFAETGSVTVTVDGVETNYLNELDCSADGTVFANVWQTDQILRIDVNSGQVTGVVDTTGAFSATEEAGADVLNGIAQIPETDRYLVTGKYWDTLYEVRFAGDVS